MKLSMIKHVLLPALALSLSTMSFAQDDLTPGPGLFSGERGQILLFKTGDNKSSPVPTKNSATNTSTPLVATDNLSEFELYKEWRSHQNSQSGNYQEFQQWIEYRQFLEKNKQ